MAKSVKMGRPKIEIDKDTFEGLCKIQCTEEEVSDVIGCSVDTINSWCKKTYFDEKTGKGQTFSEVSKKYKSYGKLSIRRYQMNLAKTSPAMAIFLGKQYLGQRDVVEERHEGDGILGDLLAFLRKDEKGGTDG